MNIDQNGNLLLSDHWYWLFFFSIAQQWIKLRL